MKDNKIEMYCSRIDTSITSPFARCAIDPWPVIGSLNETLSYVNELLERDHGADALLLTEKAIAAVLHVLPKLSVNKELEGVYRDLADAHLQASKLVRPDPVCLAKKLVGWQAYGWGDLRYDAFLEYADVLGDQGIRVYAKTAAKTWLGISCLFSPAHNPDLPIDRDMLLRTALIAAALVREPDFAETLFGNSLESSDEYFEIVLNYENQGNNSEALSWAERGMRAFPHEAQWRLCNMAARACNKLCDSAKGSRIIWLHLSEFPSRDGYALLRRHAEADGTWYNWQQAARALADAIDLQPVDGTRLKEVFLEEREAH